MGLGNGGVCDDCYLFELRAYPVDGAVPVEEFLRVASRALDSACVWCTCGAHPEARKCGMFDHWPEKHLVTPSSVAFCFFGQWEDSCRRDSHGSLIEDVKRIVHARFPGRTLPDIWFNFYPPHKHGPQDE